MKSALKGILVLMVFFTLMLYSYADNPIVTHLYTADPTARVFNDTLYIYPSHDINEHDGLSGNNGFMMADYHVFSTTDLSNYTDHGVILSQEDLDWVDNNSFAMWAPDCIQKDGKYYFYFPGNFKIGVAISDHPTGPYTPVQKPISRAAGIDPNALIDDDNTPYLYFGGGEDLKVMRMKEDMITPDMDPIVVEHLPEKYKEGSFVFKRKGIYYFTFPHSPGPSEELSYATGDNPMGPFTYQGVIMDRWTDGCWTNHHSIVEYNGQWYLFYHHHDLSKDQSLRAMCVDSLFFNDDGTIQKVTPTNRGVGLRKASDAIQVDRFTASSGLKSKLHQSKEQAGFYVGDITSDSWLIYPGVDFEKKSYTSISARVACGSSGGIIEIRNGNINGELLGEIMVENTGSKRTWKTLSSSIKNHPSGVTDLVLVFKSTTVSADLFSLNWIRFNTPETFSLEFEGNGNGTILIDESSKVHSYQTSVLLKTDQYNLVPKADEGSVFVGWRQNGIKKEKLTSFNTNDNIIANFKIFTPEINGLDTLQAEDCTSHSGIKIEACNEGGSNVGYIQPGDYLSFLNLNFKEGVNSISARVSSGTSGGQILICVDDPDTTPICTLAIKNTGDWLNWETVSASLSELKGKHDLYLLFEGTDNYLFNVNWLLFSQN